MCQPLVCSVLRVESTVDFTRVVLFPYTINGILITCLLHREIDLSAHLQVSHL